MADNINKMLTDNYKKIAIINTDVNCQDFKISEKPYVDFKIATDVSINFSPTRFILEFVTGDCYNRSNDTYLDTKNKKMYNEVSGAIIYEILTSDVEFDNLKKTLTIIGHASRKREGVIILKRIIAIG